MSGGHDQHQGEVDSRLAALEAQNKDAADELGSMAQQIRELQAAEASRSVGNQAASQQQDMSVLNEQLAALENRLQSEIAAGKVAIEQMAAEVKAESARASDAVSNIDTTELLARLNMMETNLLKLSGELELALREAQQLAKDAVQPVDGKVNELSDKVDAMAAEAAKRVEAIKRETFAIALVQLRAAIEKGSAFADFLQAFVNRFGDNEAVGPALEDLKAHAKGGVKNLETLKSELQPVIRQILSQGNDGEASFWTQTKERLARLVTVRRTGDIAGDDVDAILARAEHAMEQLNLTASLKEMKSLPESEQKKAAAWINDGEAYLAVEAALTKLEQQALMQSRTN